MQGKRGHRTLANADTLRCLSAGIHERKIEYLFSRLLGRSITLSQAPVHEVSVLATLCATQIHPRDQRARNGLRGSGYSARARYNERACTSGS